MGYKHPLLKFAHEHPIIAFFVVPLFWDLPARIFQGGVRWTKYGDYALGNAPAAMITRDEAAMNMGVGEVSNDAAFSFFGAITGEKSVAQRVDTLRSQGTQSSGVSFPPRGETYRDTQHLNSAKQGDARVVDPFYRDTSMRSQTSARTIQQDPHAYGEGGWLELKPSTTTIYQPKPADRFADPDMVDIVGGGAVFAGLSGMRRLR